MYSYRTNAKLKWTAIIWERSAKSPWAPFLTWCGTCDAWLCCGSKNCYFLYTYLIHHVEAKISYELHLMSLSFWRSLLMVGLRLIIIIVISILGHSVLVSWYVAVRFCVWRIYLYVNSLISSLLHMVWHMYLNLSMGRSHRFLYYLFVWSSPCFCIYWLVIYTSGLIGTSLVTWPSLILRFYEMYLEY